MFDRAPAEPTPTSTFQPFEQWLDQAGGAREAAWRTHVEADAHAPIALHPRSVLARPQQDAVAYVYAPHAREQTARDALALLAKRVWPIALGPRPLPALKLKGHTLVSAHVVGQDSQPTCRAFVAAAHELLARGGSAFLLFEEVDTTGPLWTALHEPAAGFRLLYPAGPEPHWRAELPDQPEVYWQKQFSGKTRSTLRRKAKKLNGNLTCYRTTEDVPRFLEAARRVSANSWQMIRLGRGVHGEAHDHERLITLAELGALRSYVLARDGQPIAFVLGYQWKDCFLYENPGYDQAHADLSPGTVLLFLIIEHLLTHDRPRYVDFEAGFHDYKQQFGNIEGTDRTVFLVKSGSLASGALAFDHFQRRARTELRGRAKALLERAGLWQALRNRYRRGGARSTDANGD